MIVLGTDQLLKMAEEIRRNVVPLRAVQIPNAKVLMKLNTPIPQLIGIRYALRLQKWKSMAFAHLQKQA